MKLANSLTRFWDQRSGSERIYLCAAGAVIVAAVLYIALLQPALTASRRLSVSLPTLRAQAEDMRQQQKEISVLRKKLAAASQHGDLKVLLQASIGRSSFVNAVERIESLSRDKALLLAAPVNFDDWLGWIENLQREFGIRLEGCKITATDQPGRVRVEATFAQGGQPVAPKTP